MILNQIPFYKFLLNLILIIPLSSFLYCQSNPDNLLLKDYRPKNIYQIPKTVIQKANYPVIDIHSHPFVKSELNLNKWLHIMDSFGIQKNSNFNIRLRNQIRFIDHFLFQISRQVYSVLRI